MHDSGLTDLALSAVVKGCQQLAYLSIQGPPLRRSRPGVTPHVPQAPAHGTITDAGLKAIAAHCSCLKGLCITRESHFAPA